MQKLNALRVPTDLLVWMWKWDESWIDYSGNWNDWTGTNITYETAENGYQSYNGVFNGSNSYVSLPTSVISNTWDIDITIKFNPISIWTSQEILIWKESTTSHYWFAIRLINSSWYKVQYLDSWNTAWITIWTVTLGDWYKVRVKRESWNYIWYLNNWTGIYTANSWTTSWTTYNEVMIWARSWWTANHSNIKLWTTFIYNEIKTEQEREMIDQYYHREFWPEDAQKNITTNHSFPFYWLYDLKQEMVLDISEPAVSGVYYEQSWNWNHSTSVSWVTDSTLGLNNVMNFDGGNDYIDFDNSINVWDEFTIKTKFYHDWSSWSNWICSISERTSQPTDSVLLYLSWTTLATQYFNSSWNAVYPQCQIPTWQWVTVEAIYANNTVRYIVNWIEQTVTNPTIVSKSINTPGSIWCLYSWSRVFFFGWQIAYVKIITKENTLEQAQEDYYSNFIPNN